MALIPGISSSLAPIQATQELLSAGQPGLYYMPTHRGTHLHDNTGAYMHAHQACMLKLTHYYRED